LRFGLKPGFGTEPFSVFCGTEGAKRYLDLLVVVPAYVRANHFYELLNSRRMIAAAIEAARAESMTLKQNAQLVEDVHGVPFPCRVDTLSAALRRARFFPTTRPILAQKKRDQQGFSVKADTLSESQQAARDAARRQIYFDQSGFSASPAVQRGWSPIGEPHRVFRQPHCRRSVLAAIDFGANLLKHEVSTATIKRPSVVRFLDQIAQPGLMTVVVLDNASIHHDSIRQRSTAGSSIIAWFSSIFPPTVPG
jgi:hypothetical protein